MKIVHRQRVNPWEDLRVFMAGPARPGIITIGSWVPKDYKVKILSDYDEIAAVPIMGAIGQVRLIPKVAGLLREAEITNLGQLLSLSMQDLYGLKHFNTKNLKELKTALKLIVDVARLRMVEISKTVLSAELIDQVFSGINDRYTKITRSMLGFDQPGVFASAGEIAAQQGVGGSRIHWIFRETIDRLQRAEPSLLLTGLDLSIMNVANRLFENQIVITIEQLRQGLQEDGLLTDDAVDFVLPVLLLLDQVKPEGRFAFVAQSSGRQINSLRQCRGISIEQFGLVADYDK